MLFIHGFTKNRSLLVAIITGSVFLSGCSGSTEETLLDILELPGEEQQNTVQPQTPAETASEMESVEPEATDPEPTVVITEPVEQTEPTVIVTEPVEPVEPEPTVVVATLMMAFRRSDSSDLLTFYLLFSSLGC